MVATQALAQTRTSNHISYYSLEVCSVLKMLQKYVIFGKLYVVLSIRKLLHIPGKCIWRDYLLSPRKFEDI